MNPSRNVKYVNFVFGPAIGTTGTDSVNEERANVQKAKISELVSWAKANADVSRRDQWDAWLAENQVRQDSAGAQEWPGLAELFARLSPLCVRGMKTFGGVAAEDDAVLNYFVTTPAVQQIRDGEVFLVLGRKGSGKTALVRHFTEGQASPTSRALTLGSYPWHVHEQRGDATVSEVEAYVASWRYLIAVQFAALLMEHPDIDMHTSEAASISEFLRNNYGGSKPELGDILRPPALKLSKASFEPQILGNKLGSISLEQTNSNAGRELRALTDALFEALQTLGAACGIESISLHFDELDLGLVSLSEPRKHMLIGLVLAAREVSRWAAQQSMRCWPVVYLRTDLWEQFRFSDKNKISNGRTLNLEWDSASLLNLVAERIRATVAPNANWSTVASPSAMRGSQAKWDHIVARTFLRPRDVISFLNVALAAAKKRDIDATLPLVLENPDIINARDGYSVYLKQELEDEIVAHWPYWEDALRAFSAIATVTFHLEQFKQEYERRKSAANTVTAEDALATLYGFSVIGYERRSGYGGSAWVFQYVNPEAGWDGGSTRFKVHVGLKEVAKLREERIAGLTGAADNSEE
jgi:energy-coupling factor transporter ATP-binding protein EcfA2